jgi:hypothetical protein
MKKLQLSLKKQWFEMTKAGIKTEDYREITPYWVKRFVNLHKDDMNYNNFYNYLIGEIDRIYYADNYSFKSFKTNTMTLGYPKSTDIERVLIFEHQGIEIRTGYPEWGAVEGRLYFVIKHGKRIQ